MEIVVSFEQPDTALVPTWTLDALMLRPVVRDAWVGVLCGEIEHALRLAGWPRRDIARTDPVQLAVQVRWAYDVRVAYEMHDDAQIRRLGVSAAEGWVSFPLGFCASWDGTGWAHDGVAHRWDHDSEELLLDTTGPYARFFSDLNPKPTAGVRRCADDQPFLTDGEHDYAAAALQSALRLIRHLDPGVAQWVRTAAPIVAVLPPLGGGESSFSHPSMLLAFCTSPHDSIGLAESLIHEASHQVLTVCEALAPLAEPDPTPIMIPGWRTDARPARALMAGAHAFAHVARWHGLVATGARLSSREIQASAAIASTRGAQVLRVLAALESSNKLTFLGRALTKRLRVQAQVAVDRAARAFCESGQARPAGAEAP